MIVSKSKDCRADLGFLVELLVGECSREGWLVLLLLGECSRKGWLVLLLLGDRSTGECRVLHVDPPTFWKGGR